MGGRWPGYRLLDSKNRHISGASIRFIEFLLGTGLADDRFPEDVTIMMRAHKRELIDAEVSAILT